MQAFLSPQCHHGLQLGAAADCTVPRHVLHCIPQPSPPTADCVFNSETLSLYTSLYFLAGLLTAPPASALTRKHGCVTGQTFRTHWWASWWAAEWSQPWLWRNQAEASQYVGHGAQPALYGLMLLRTFLVS